MYETLFAVIGVLLAIAALTVIVTKLKTRRESKRYDGAPIHPERPGNKKER